MSINAADAPKINELKKREKRKHKLREEAFTSVASTAEGRRVFAWLFELTHTQHTTFHVEPQMAAFKEGERAIGLQIQGEMMRLCPERYAEMIHESIQDAKLRRAFEASEEKEDGGNTDDDY